MHNGPFPYKDRYGGEYSITIEPVMYQYPDDGGVSHIALIMHDKNDYAPYAIATVNVAECIKEEDCSAIDTNNLGDEIVEWLEQFNIATRTGRFVHSGYCKYPICKINPEIVKSVADYKE